MDIFLDLDTSLYWQIPLGLLLLVLTIFFLWLPFRIGQALKSVENLLDRSIPNLLKATENLLGVHEEVSTLLISLNGTVTKLNQTLPQLLENINGITASVQQISESEVRATTYNIQEITETINQNIGKIDELVNAVTGFSQTTLKHAEFYRDCLAGAVTDVISAWSALKASWKRINGAWKSHASD